MIALIAEKATAAAHFSKILNEYGVEVVSASGHIIELDELIDYFPEAKKSMDKWGVLLPHLPFFPKEYKKHITNTNLFQKIAKVVSAASEIVLACDSGREGVLIERDILYYLRKRGLVKTNKISRMWLSDGESNTAVKKAFLERKDYRYYDGHYLAAHTRQIIDYDLGMNLTVLYTKKCDNVGRGALTIGRVQSWLLFRIVKRYFENINFISKMYWRLEFQSENGITFKHINKDEKLIEYYDQSEVKRIYSEITGKPLNVTDKNIKPFHEWAPNLYDLKNLQKDCSKLYKFSLEKTLNITQSLYDKHIISYPRTECDKLPEEESKLIYKAIDLCSKHTPLKHYIDLLKEINPEFILADKYKGTPDEHYALIPILYYEEEGFPILNEEEEKVFTLIGKRLILALMPPARGNETIIKGSIEKECFRTTYKEYLSYGWKELVKNKPGELTEGEIRNPVNINKGNLLKGLIEMIPGKTEAPKLFDAYSILVIMEKAHEEVKDEKLKLALKNSDGIGTAATRSTFIEKLLKNNYVILEKNMYKPTQRGIDLVKYLPDEIKQADFSAKMEYDLKGFIEGRPGRKPEDMIRESEDLIKKIFSDICSNKDLKVSSGDEILGKCPKCGKNITEKKMAFDCGDRNCGYVIFKNTSGTKLSATSVKLLLQGKETKELKLKNKEGKEYKAKLKLGADGKLEKVFVN